MENLLNLQKYKIKSVSTERTNKIFPKKDSIKAVMNQRKGANTIYLEAEN